MLTLVFLSGRMNSAWLKRNYSSTGNKPNVIRVNRKVALPVRAINDNVHRAFEYTI